MVSLELIPGLDTCGQTMPLHGAWAQALSTHLDHGRANLGANLCANLCANLVPTASHARRLEHFLDGQIPRGGSRRWYRRGQRSWTPSWAPFVDSVRGHRACQGVGPGCVKWLVGYILAFVVLYMTCMTHVILYMTASEMVFNTGSV